LADRRLRNTTSAIFNAAPSTGAGSAVAVQRDPEADLGFLRDGARPSTGDIVRFINEHRERCGVDPICDRLQVVRSTYYKARSRPPSARSCVTGELKGEIVRVHTEDFDLYGIEKVWKQLRREGT